MVCPYSLSRPGGVQGQAVGLARVLADRGHDVTLFAPIDRPDDAPGGIEFVASGRSIGLPANGSVAPVSVSIPAARRALRALHAMAPQVVHVHEPFTPGLPYGVLADRNRPPTVATFHRSGSSAWYSLLRPLTTRAARRIDVRCAVSEAARATAAEALGGEYEVLFNGVEVEGVRGADPWPTDRPVILFLGRHETRKGLGVLLEAFDALRAAREGRTDAAHRTPVLWIAGDGPRTATLRHRHPESADIRWLGVLDAAEKLRRLKAASLLCAPSLAGESFGMVLLEAMAAGTVVVASDIEGYRAAAGGHAVLVPPGQVDALARALDGVLSGHLATGSARGSEEPPCDRGGEDEDGAAVGTGRRAWTGAAQEWADRWSMEELAARYEECYRSAVLGARR